MQCRAGRAKPSAAKTRILYAPDLQVADAQSVPSIPDGELFVRLECGKATQFTQPQPLLKGVCTWQHDFLFIDLPVHPDSRDHTVLKADGALKTEVFGFPFLHGRLHPLSFCLSKQMNLPGPASRFFRSWDQ